MPMTEERLKQLKRYAKENYYNVYRLREALDEIDHLREGNERLQGSLNLLREENRKRGRVAVAAQTYMAVWDSETEETFVERSELREALREWGGKEPSKQEG